MKKKIWGLLPLSVLIALSLAACSGISPMAPERETLGDSSAGSMSSGQDEQIIAGIITDAAMSTLTINENQGGTYTFATGDADKTTCSGLATGSAVWVAYTGSLSGEDTAGVTVTRLAQAEEKSATGTVNEGSAMHTLVLDASDGKTRTFPLIDACLAQSSGMTTGERVQVFYAENAEATDLYKRVVTRFIPAESSVSGTITDASMNTITIRAEDGKTLSFSTVDADKSLCNGLEIGSGVTVYYTGVLNDSDTSGVTVTRLEQTK